MRTFLSFFFFYKIDLKKSGRTEMEGATDTPFLAKIIMALELATDC